MHTIKYLCGCSAVFLSLATAIQGHTFELLIPPKNQCGTNFVAPQDLVDISGLPANAGSARKIHLDTTTVLLHATRDLPQIPEWLPEIWTKSGIVTSTLRIRNENLQKNKMTTEMETFLVIQFSEPMTVCNILAGWEAWTLRQIEKPNVLFNEVLLVFIHRGERKILRDYVTVTLIPGVHPDTFRQEVLVPLEKDLRFHPAVSLADQNQGVWKMMLRVKETSFPLRAARILSGQRQFISNTAPVFIPYISTISTKSVMERIGSDGTSVRFHDGETIYSEQAAFDAALELSVTVDLLRNENGKPYFKLLTNPSELAKSIEEAVRPKTEGALRVDAGACWEHTSDNARGKTLRVLFVCRFVPALPGRFEIIPLPLRFEIETGGTAFTINTERSFVLNTVELRHPEQDGIVSYIGDLSALPTPQALLPQEEKTDGTTPVLSHMRRTIGGTIKLLISAVQENIARFIHAPSAFLRQHELTIVMTLAAIFVFSFLLRTYLWGWGIVPSAIVACKAGTVFVRNLVSYASIPLSMDRDPSQALRKVIAVIHKGEDIENTSIESLALRSGIALDPDCEAFYTWAVQSSRSRLESIFAALWIEEHRETWKLPRDTVHAYHAHLLRPFSLRHFLALPAYLHTATLEYQKRGGIICR